MFKPIAIGAILSLAASSPAWADATLYGAPLRPGSDASTATCSAVNVSRRAVDVEVDVVGVGGNQAGRNCTQLLPGQVCEKTFPNSVPSYCKITVTGTSRKGILGSYRIDNANGMSILSIPVE